MPTALQLNPTQRSGMPDTSTHTANASMASNDVPDDRLTDRPSFSFALLFVPQEKQQAAEEEAKRLASLPLPLAGRLRNLAPPARPITSTPRRVQHSTSSRTALRKSGRSTARATPTGLRAFGTNQHAERACDVILVCYAMLCCDVMGSWSPTQATGQSCGG